MVGSGRAGDPPQEHRGEARHEGVVRLQGYLREVRYPTAATRRCNDLDHEITNQELQVPVEGDNLELLLALGADEHHGDDVVAVHGHDGRTKDHYRKLARCSRNPRH